MTQSMLYRKKGPNWGIGGLFGFSLLSVGQIVSLIGSGMTCFAQAIWIYTDQGGSIINLTMLAVLAQLPGVLISPIAGVLIDRWDRRWVMIISNGVAALATLALRALIVTNNFEIWHIYVITCVISIANHFQWPAFFATIPLVVPKKSLGSANGLVQVARSLGLVAAPFMAGIIVTLFSIQGVILFDMVSYTVAFLTLLIVRIPRPPLLIDTKTNENSFKNELIYGWKYLLERPGLVRVTLLFSASGFLMSVVSILMLPMALNTISASEYGSLASVGGVCMLISGLAVTIWGIPKNRVQTMLAMMLLQGVAIVLAGLQPSMALWLTAFSIFFFVSPILNTCSEVIWQSKVAPHVQGRVLAVTWMASVIAGQLGFLVGGPLAEYVFEPLMIAHGRLAGSIGKLIGTGAGRGIGLMFILFGVVYIGTTVVLGYFSRRLQKLDAELPDEIDNIHPKATSYDVMPTIGAVLTRE